MKTCTVQPDGECSDDDPCELHNCTADHCQCIENQRPRAARHPGLTKAVELVQAVIDQLNLSEHKCPTCTLTVRESKDDYQAFYELGAVKAKLEKWAVKMAERKI